MVKNYAVAAEVTAEVAAATKAAAMAQVVVVVRDDRGLAVVVV